MKPILFPSDATTFTTNGLGSLDPTSCVVTEERNGQYELECVVPVESPHFDEIHNNMILVVIPGDGGSVHPVSQRQAFRIYHVTEPMNGLVTLSARHISYDLSYNTVMPPITASSITTAFSAIAANMVETNRFTFDTDKSTAANFKVSVPQTARQLLGGQSGSILDVYGGEYQWDNWRVCLWNHRGQDTDVTLRYGKNITDISQEENIENVITGIVPYWADENETLTLPEKSIDSTYASQYPYKRTVPVDFSSDWEEKPTESQLRSRGQSYVNSNRIGIPKVSIKVSFVALWQTDEYKDIAPLERVHLCDTVGVVFEKYGINTRAEVIKTEWDCLTERYLSIELGEPRSNFAKTIVDLNEQTTQEIVEAKSDMQKAIDAATEAITGVNGGYIKINSTSDGKPYEILIMDNEDASQAVTVWRYNLAGWGVSTNGINGPYSMAATLNSTYGASINADYIIAGTMLADRIHGGVLTLGGDDNGNGIFHIKDANDNVICTIDNTGIRYGNQKFIVDSTGALVASGATINGTISSVKDGNETRITDSDITFKRNGVETGRIRPYINRNNVARLELAYKDRFMIDYDGDETGTKIEMDDDSIQLYVNGSPSASYVSLSDDGSMGIGGHEMYIGDGNSDELHEQASDVYVRDAFGTDHLTWTGIINGVSDGNGNYGDITVTNGRITNWSGW